MPEYSDDPLVVLLAGGESRRMMTDKASLIWRGRKMLEHTAATCRAAGLEMVVAGREKPDNWQDDVVVFIPDETAGQGPLAGLVTAFERFQPQSVLALACDMPLLTPEALRWLIQRRDIYDDDKDGLIVADASGRLQFLFSIYALRSLPKMRGRLDNGLFSMKGLVEAGDFAVIQAENWVEPLLANANTPEEWARLSGVE